MNGFVHDIGVGVATGIPMLVVVGPIALLLVDLGSQRGVRAGTPAALGVALGDLLLAVVVAIGGTALAALIAPIADGFRIVAAVMVAGMAMHVVHSVRRSSVEPALASSPEANPDAVVLLEPSDGATERFDGATERFDGAAAPLAGGSGRLLGGFAALTLANPLTLLVYVGLVLGGGAGVGTAGWVVGMGVASLAVHGSWVGVGHVMGTAVPAGALRVMRYAAAGLLLGLAIHLLAG